MANVWTCDVLLSYLGNLPADMVGVRVLIVVTCGVSILAVPPMVCGMKSTKLVSDESGQKQSLICTSGVLYLFAGVSGTGGLLWYGAETFIKYQEEVLLGIPGVTHELGYSYWFAVGGVACMLWSGLALLILNRLACKNGRTQSNRAPADQQPRWATGDKTYV
ncbi:claudin-16-like [Arapaima gigas]